MMPSCQSFGERQRSSLTKQISEEQSKEEIMLNSFASLLSSAQTFGLQEPLLPLPEPTLAKFLSPNVEFDKVNPYGRYTCSFPSLSLKNELTSSSNATKGMSLQETAALNLAFPIFVDKEDVATAPVTLLENISSSFMTLIDSRLRSSRIALFGENLKSGSSAEAKALLKLLCGNSSASSPISLTTIVTSYRVLPMTEEITGTDVFLPIVFEATMDLTALGTLFTTSIQAPGTITGGFGEEDGLLERVELVFDTIALLQSMMKQVRYVVRKTIARAAGIAKKMTSIPSSSSLSSLSLKNLQSVASSGNLRESFNANSLMTPSILNNKSMSGDEKDFTNFNLPQVTSSLPQMLKSNANFMAQSVPSMTTLQPSDTADTQNQHGKNNEQPYELFSWLAGDKMFLKQEDDSTQTNLMNPPTNLMNRHSLKANSTRTDGSTRPLKRNRVSFSNDI